MNLVDTHCHIHEADYPLDCEAVLRAATENKVTKIICVGTDLMSSRDAVKFAREHNNVWAIIGVHPHETKPVAETALTPELRAILAKKVVGVGEIGLDYYYNHSPRQVQIAALNRQIEFALKHDLPISFHVREAFDDFWPIFDNFHGVKGVLHSFTDTATNMKKALEHGLYIGVNGIATFNKNPAQHAMYEVVPPESMLLETDAPFLSPPPHRGKPNQPAYVRNIAEFMANLQGRSVQEIAQTTTKNAKKLFHI